MDNSSYKRKVKEMSSGKREVDLEEIMVHILFFLNLVPQLEAGCSEGSGVRFGKRNRGGRW